MKIGISITSAYPLGSERDGAASMVARAKAAADAGLDSLFVGDHHVVPTPYYQNTPMLGRLLAEWDHRHAGALFLLPLWNPVLLAEQVSTLACITHGPFIMQCALGANDYQFKAMGANIKFRPSAFEQSLGALRALWEGETVSLSGRWNIENAKIAPLPPEKIEVWIGASAPIAIERAARLGDAWLAEPGLTLTSASEQLHTYKRAIYHQKKELPKTIAIRRDIYVAESDKDAREVQEFVKAKGYRGFDNDALIIGDASAVAEAFYDLYSLGYTDIIIRNLHRSQEKALASTKRLIDVREKLGLK
ncbi:MAG: LLM class flavin-dependent oxidoreductase [Pseudomonadota bacterium]|nr:LLM class flavin-dependent oxidoreductase [Pseudomonadota bacterium]